MRITVAVHLGSWFAVVALASACSGHAATGTVAPVPIDQAPASEVNAFCSGYATCCSSKGFVFNAAACQTNLQASVAVSPFCPAPNVYDAQAAGECFAEMQAAYANCSSSPGPNSACYRACTGSLPAGSACTSSLECAVPTDGSSVSCTTLGTTSSTTVCVIEPRGKQGDDCTATCVPSAIDGYICDSSYAITSNPTPKGTAQCFTNDGLHCSSVDFTCQPLVAIGGSCAATSDCLAGSYCDPNMSLCQQRLAAGSACGLIDECIENTYCDYNSVCSPKQPIGASCNNVDECINYCDTTNHCVATNTSLIHI